MTVVCGMYCCCEFSDLSTPSSAKVERFVGLHGQISIFVLCPADLVPVLALFMQSMPAPMGLWERVNYTPYKTSIVGCTAAIGQQEDVILL